jgi:hypothetical protein
VRETVVVFFTLLFSYAYFFGGSGFNQNATFALTRALVEQRQLHIDDYASNTADVSFHAGHAYSNKAPGLAILAAVPYTVFYAIHGAPRNAIELNLALYLCTLAVCGVSGALIGVLLRKRGAPFGVALLVGLGTPLFAYSTMLFAHVPAALLVLLAYLLLEREKPALAGAALGAAVFVNYLCAPLVLLFAVRRQRLRSLRSLHPRRLPIRHRTRRDQYAAFGSPFRTAVEVTNPVPRSIEWLGFDCRSSTRCGHHVRHSADSLPAPVMLIAVPASCAATGGSRRGGNHHPSTHRSTAGTADTAWPALRPAGRPAARARSHRDAGARAAHERFGGIAPLQLRGHRGRSAAARQPPRSDRPLRAAGARHRPRGR